MDAYIDLQIECEYAFLNPVELGGGGGRDNLKNRKNTYERFCFLSLYFEKIYILFRHLNH